MISAQDAVELSLQAAASANRCDETIVIVTDRSEASLRWAGNSMTTNGVSTTRSTTVISLVRSGDRARAGVVRSSVVDPDAIDALVAAADKAAHTAPEARDSAPLIAGAGEPADWCDPVPGTGVQCRKSPRSYPAGALEDTGSESRICTAGFRVAASAAGAAATTAPMSAASATAIALISPARRISRR